MIHRLDSPSAQATFSVDSAGIPPTSSKWSIPVNQIRYTDTVYTAPSNGLTTYWYSNTSLGRTIPVGTSYTGNMPLMKQWYGTGLPPVFNIGDISDKWSVKYKGYFKFDYTDDYTFHFGGEGHISKFEIGGANYLSEDGSVSEYELDLSATSYATSKTFSNATVGKWELVEIDYEQRSSFGKKNSGLCMLWETDNSVATPDKIVISAGVTHTFGGGVPVDGLNAISDTALSGFSDVKLNLTERQGSTFTFEMPFISSSNPVSTAGVYYDPGSELYIDNNSGQALKKFRKIEYLEGYRKNDTDEMVQRFSGQIRDFEVGLDPNGNDVVEITCHDYSIFAKEQFNIDAPNPIDYIAAGYMDEVAGHVDGLTRPPSFDGWELHKAFEIMAMNSYLDPYYMTLRERKSNIAGDLIYSNYAVQSHGLGYNIYLDRHPVKYGNPLGVEPDAKIKGATLPPDEKYLHTVGFGENYQDSLNKIVSTYGMQWGVNRLGHPFLKLLDSPRSYMNDRDTGDITFSGQWTQDKSNVNAFKATYSSAQTVWSSVEATFTGSKCEALVGYHPNGGYHVSGDTAGQIATIFTEIRKGGVKVNGTSQWFNTYLSTAWHSHDGIYPALGFNPSVLKIGNDLTYDTYTVHLWRHNTTPKEIRFEGFKFYDDDLDGEKFSFTTSDENGPGQVTSLDATDTGNDIRNEAYVLGRFVGYEYEIDGVQNDEEDSEIKTSITNPNNPAGQYVQSVTRDVDSIFKSTASNFVGMPRRTIITDPSIGSQSQADYLSYNFVQQFANPAKNISFGTIGNPMLEVNDKVFVEDEHSQVVDSSKSFWITNVGSDFDKTYESDYDATTFRPIGSFFPKPQPNITDDFAGIPILNLRVENRGNVGRLTAILSKAETTEMELTTVTGMPERGYIHLQQYVGGLKTHEIIKYGRRDPDGTDPGKVYDLSRGLQRSSSRAWSINDYAMGAYDPYLQEGTGIVPTIKFDSLVSGKMYLKVIGDLSGEPVHVNTLTGIGEEDWPFATYDTVQWGANYLYTWDARDAVGKWNRYHVTIDEQNDMKGDVGYYVAEKKDIQATPGDSETYAPQHGNFFLDFRFLDDDGTVWNFSSKRGDGIIAASSLIQTRRGPVGTVNFHIQYEGCHYPRSERYYKNSPDNVYEPRTIQARNFVRCSTSYSAIGPREQPITDTSYRYHHLGIDEVTNWSKAKEGANYWSYESPNLPGNQWYANPFAYWSQGWARGEGASLNYFTSTANDGKGLKTIMRSGGTIYGGKIAKWPAGDHQIQEELDTDYRRRYSVDLKWRRNVLTAITHGPYVRMFGSVANGIVLSPGQATMFHEFTDGDFLVDDALRYDFYNNGNGIELYFNPANLTGNEAYDFQPTGSHVWQGWSNVKPYRAPGAGLENGPDHKQMFFYNYVLFHGGFADGSGRSPIIYGDLIANASAIKSQGMDKLMKDPTDTTSGYRYDENLKARVVGYVDYSLDTFMENEPTNNLPNLVQVPTPVIGWDHEGLKNAWDNVPPIQWNFFEMWFHKRG